MISLAFISIDNWWDLILEGLSVLGYIFVLIMAFNAKKNNKIFAAKPFPIIVIAIIVGLISAIMDVCTEFLWIDKYSVYKTTFGILQIASLLFFAVGILYLFKNTYLLFVVGIVSDDKAV